MPRLPPKEPKSLVAPASESPSRVQVMPHTMPPRRRRITAPGADDDGAHLHGRAARGALNVVEQWPWARLAPRGRGGVELAQLRIHLAGSGNQGSAGRRAG